MVEDSNTPSLEHFEQFVRELKRTLPRLYDRSINKDLSRQQWQDLFMRNVTSALRQGYDEATAQLRKLPLTPAGDDLTVQVLKPFDGFIDEFMQYALQKHRTSCALSNFPDEHKPSQDYIAAVLEQAHRDWRAFAAKVQTELS